MTATTRRQLTREERARAAAVISLQKAGIADENDQRHICAVWARRPIASRTELTEDEARSLARRVKTMSRDELAAVLARPIPEPPELDGALRAEIADGAAELPPGVIVCGGDQTPGDIEQVRAFAEFLSTAGPAPSVEELAAVREPAPCLATWCEDDACTAEHPEREPVAVCPEEGAATCRAKPGECCMETPAPAIEPEPVPVAVEPPPEDVEAAAVAAVEQFRARQAAGITPEPPNLLSIPPRVPLQLGPAPGRYCLATCYCGGCSHWQPIPPVDYSKTPGSKDYERIHGKWR